MASPVASGTLFLPAASVALPTPTDNQDPTRSPPTPARDFGKSLQAGPSRRGVSRPLCYGGGPVGPGNPHYLRPPGYSVR